MSNGFLHNSLRIDVYNITLAMLKTSIEWYEQRIAEEKYAPSTIKDFKEKLAICKAEYAEKIGKK